MSGRKLNALEQRLHQVALANPQHTLTQQECIALIPDASARTAALNFLLGTGLLKALKAPSGGLSFRAVLKQELDVKKDMNEEEALILSHIQAAQNEGIWTKHLKAKTQLHQTVIDRCLKSLTQKKLVKTATNHKFPTRKIYMLYHLQPSEEMTGGPWYTDNELDTEFIKLLCSACMRFVRDRSMPRRRGEDPPSTMQQLYPISAAPQYPTAQQILSFLSRSRITETQLTVGHVESLLNVLVLDGEIERVPAFGRAMWEASDDGADISDENDGERSTTDRKRKRHARDDSDSPVHERKRSRGSRSLDLTGEDDGLPRRKRLRSDSDSESGLESDTDHESAHRSRSQAAASKKRKHSSSPGGVDVTASFLQEDFGAYVYRAVRQESVAGGLSQAPCVRCPTFDFCKDSGPVNPRECQYYETWLVAQG